MMGNDTQSRRAFNSGTFQFRGVGYPQRSAFFANKFQRTLMESSAASSVGPEGFALLCAISMIEDRARYGIPATLFDDRLVELAGFRSKKQLARVRLKCVEQGWLHYERPQHRGPGVYWVIIPEWADSLSHLDLTHPDTIPQGRVNGHQEGTKRESKGQTYIPIPNPKNPPPNPEGEEEDLEKLLKKVGIARFKQCLKEALANQMTVEQIRSVVGHYQRHQPAWGPGALYSRLISPEAPTLAPDEGWPNPSPKAAAERERQKSAALHAKIKDSKQKKAAEHTKQLEFQFGRSLDELPESKAAELIGISLEEFEKYGVQSPTIRPRLLRAFKEIYGEAGSTPNGRPPVADPLPSQTGLTPVADALRMPTKIPAKSLEQQLRELKQFDQERETP